MLQEIIRPYVFIIESVDNMSRGGSQVYIMLVTDPCQWIIQ